MKTNINPYALWLAITAKIDNTTDNANIVSLYFNRGYNGNLTLIRDNVFFIVRIEEGDIFIHAPVFQFPFVENGVDFVNKYTLTAHSLTVLVTQLFTVCDPFVCIVELGEIL